ncbi:MAG: phage holin family protein [Clostridium sp.]
MNNLVELVPNDLGIVIAATYVMGIYLKSQPRVKDHYIPTVLVLLAIVASMLISGFNVNSLLQGILCWGISIGINQTAKQIIKGEE